MIFSNWRPAPAAAAPPPSAPQTVLSVSAGEPVLVPGFTGLVEDLFDAVGAGDDTHKLRVVLAEPHTDPNGLLAGQTALHVAAERGNVNCVRVLLAAGAMVNISDDCGYTALHRAAAADRPETTALIARAKHAGASRRVICGAFEHAAAKSALRALEVLWAELCVREGEVESELVLPGLVEAARTASFKAVERVLSYVLFTEGGLTEALEAGVLS